MSKRVKTQLEIYMEELEMVGAENEVPTASTITGLWFSTCGTLGLFTTCALLAGVVEDVLVLFVWFGGVCFYLDSTVTRTSENVLVSGARRLLQCFLTISVVQAIVASIMLAPCSLLDWASNQVVKVVFCILVVFPVLLGLFTSWLTVRITHQARAAQYTTECLLGAVKRVQLVRMGSSISHPMPPVSKLEESFLRAHSEDTELLTFGEIRVFLKDALHHLHSALGTSGVSNVDNAKRSGAAAGAAVTLSQLEHLCSVVFPLQRAASTRHANTLCVELELAKVACWGLVCMNTSNSSDALDEDVLIQDASPVDPMSVLLRVVWCVGEVLALPCRLCGVLFALEVYLKRCRDMSGGLSGVCIPPHTAKLTITTTTTTTSTTTSVRTTHINAAHRYFDTYVSARQKLARLRAAYEDITVRLWLADQQLAEAPTLQCVFPDAALPAHTTDLCAANSDIALQRLCGNANISRNSTLSTKNEALESIGMLLDGLPSLRDFEVLCEDLYLLQAASAAHTTPALYKRGIADTMSVPVQRVIEAPATSVSTSNVRVRDGQDTQSMFEEDSTQDPNTLLPTTTNKLHPTTSNILDVYTTTVPRRAVMQRKADVSAADVAAAARERAHAKLLFRELNQHLRRGAKGHAPPQAPTEVTGDISTDTRLLVPLAGQYALERVRHITSKQASTDASEPLNTAGDADDGELQIETNLTQVDVSAFELCQLSDSEDEEQDISHNAHQQEEKKYRVGTVLLTEQEMRSASQSTSSAALPVNDVKSFQEEMRQALRGMTSKAPSSGNLSGSGSGTGGGGVMPPVSAFALAMRSNHSQEASFGDELSD